MSDHRRRRSPIGNPARMSAPVITAGTPSVNYGRSADLHGGTLHAIPTRREHFVSPRSSGASIETATHYKIKPDRDLLALPRPERSRSRRSTIDSTTKPIIVTPTTGYNVVVGEPRSARESREDYHGYREDGYVQPASSQHRHQDREYRGARSQYTIDNANVAERHPHDRETVNDRLLRVGSAREGQMYPRARPITDSTLVRHPDTVKDDYGDDGYGYTNPKDLVEYDLERTQPRSSGGLQRSNSRRESWDNSRGGRPVSVSGYGDLSRPYDRGERERGPPPTTRGFDKIPGDRNGGMYHMPGSTHMPMPHEHIAASPLSQAPTSAYPNDNLGIPQRRTSTRRPVSVYHDDQDRRDSDRGREDYDIVDGRVRRADGYGAHEDVQARGFGIRPDLLPPSNVVTVQPPAAMERSTADRVERAGREEDRLSPRNREEKRYHDSGEKRYHGGERDYRRDDRDRSERRPEHDDRLDGRKVGAGMAAGSIAAAAMGVGAPAREPRLSDEERERERERRHRRDSDQYYNERPSRRNTLKDDEPPIVNLSGRDPIERTSPRDDRMAREPRDREYRAERDDPDSRRDRDRDSDIARREAARDPNARRESPLQSEKVDLSERHPVIERNVAKEDTHYPTEASRTSPPLSRRDRDDDSVADAQRRGVPLRDRFYDDAVRGETISSPVTFSDKEARDLRALREDMGLDKTVEDSSSPPRPPKEALEPAVGFSRQSTDRSSDRPLDPPSRQSTAERSFENREARDVPAALRTEISAATAGTMSSSASRDSRPSYHDRGYSSTSTSSSSGSNIGTPRERSRERSSRDHSNKPSTSLQVVSPPRSPSSSQATLPVKGILKPPRVFPDLPPEERPGVAPLIDKKTGKNWDGREMADVPATARWTKISRRLVNPDALEKGKERYEVRDDFVVVLRVLTKDEIQGYAVLTQGLRAQKEEERRRRRGGDDGEDDRDERRRRRRDDDETEDERAERKRKEREREERRRKYEDEETSEEREERKAKEREREERHRKRREDRDGREGREDETADEAEERRRRERAERHERHKRERRERYGAKDNDEDYAKEREERRRRHRDRRDRERDSGRNERDRERERERDRERAKDGSSESDTEDDDREERRRRRRDRD